jgi:serine protease
LLNAINRADAQGMLFVAAAGNSGTDNDAAAFYPANYEASNVVAVAATDNLDALASFSNYGATTVDLGAPGVYIASTVRRGGYAYMSGTSMATPHVSGAAALVLSKCTLTTGDLKSRLLENLDPVASLAGKTFKNGRLNVYKALNSCATAPSPDFDLSASPASVSVTQGSSASSAITVATTNGFINAVTLTKSGLPAGATATFSLNPVSGSGISTLTISTTSTSTPTGTYTITVIGTSGSVVRTTTISLTVTAPVTSSFTLSVSPSSRSIKRGQSTSYTVSVTPSGGFSGAVGLSVSGLPAYSNGVFSPASVTGSGTSTLTVTTTKNTRAGTYALTITGTSGVLSDSATATLNLR